MSNLHYPGLILGLRSPLELGGVRDVVCDTNCPLFTLHESLSSLTYIFIFYLSVFVPSRITVLQATHRPLRDCVR